MVRPRYLTGDECLCVPALKFVCGLCRDKPEAVPATPEVAQPEIARIGPDLTGFGYYKGGYDRDEPGAWCSPEEHYEWRFMAELEDSFKTSQI